MSEVKFSATYSTKHSFLTTIISYDSVTAACCQDWAVVSGPKEPFSTTFWIDTAKLVPAV